MNRFVNYLISCAVFDKLLALIEWCVPEQTVDPATIRKILIVDMNFRGDMLMSSPAIRALKENLPHAQIHVMAFDFCKEVLEANPYIDKLYLVKRLNPWNCIKAMFRDYDLVMQFNTSLKTNFWMFFAGTRYRLGYNYRHRGCFNNVRPSIQFRTARCGNRVIENLYLVWYATPCKMPKGTGYLNLIFAVPDEWKRERRNIVIHVSPGRDYQKRMWAHWPELVDCVIERYGEVIFTGSYEDVEYIEWVRSKIRNKHKTTNLAGIYTIPQFAELLCSTKLLVTVNTFAMHLGVALNTPTVAIIGGTPASVVAPLDKKNFRYIEDPGLAEYDPKTALYPIQINGIKPEEVMREVDNVLADYQPSGLRNLPPSVCDGGGGES